MQNNDNFILCIFGEVAEWLKAPHSKRGKLERVSGVQISLSPQKLTIIIYYDKVVLV